MSIIWRFVLGVLGAVMVYLLLVRLRNVYMIFREYYVLWNIAIGGRSDRRTIAPRSRLHVYVSKTNLLDNLSVNEIFAFYHTMIDTDITVAQFQKVMLSYKFVILCRERIDGSLRGALLLDVRDSQNKGEIVKLFRLGLGFMHRHYQGNALLYFVGAYLVLKEMLLHPLTPVYMIGKAFSYKSYLMGTRLFPNDFYPRYNAETPEFEQSIINDYAEAVKMPGDVYRPETGVIEREMSKIKDFVVGFSEKDLENPHIKFFNDRNPGWLKGHYLIGVAKVTWIDLFKMALYTFKRLRKKKSKKSSKKRERLLSFQNEEARAYARKNSTELRKIHEMSFEREHIRSIEEESSGTSEDEVFTPISRKGSAFNIHLF